MIWEELLPSSDTATIQRSLLGWVRSYHFFIQASSPLGPIGKVSQLDSLSLFMKSMSVDTDYVDRWLCENTLHMITYYILQSIINVFVWRIKVSIFRTSLRDNDDIYHLNGSFFLVMDRSLKFGLFFRILINAKVTIIIAKVHKLSFLAGENNFWLGPLSAVDKTINYASKKG